MSTPAGWYDDGHGAQRWWDGNAWTDHVQPPASAPVAPGFPPATGYPGANGHTPGQEPAKTSKLWILWVVLGGVVLLLIVAAAILIPLLIGLFSNAAGGGSSSPDEQAAVDAVLLYDEAYDEGECDLYEQATTSFFRDENGYSVCADFESAAESFEETTDDYEVEITGVSSEEDGSIVVTTTETYLSYLDDEGNELDAPEAAEDLFSYTVVDDGGRWAIDDLR